MVNRFLMDADGFKVSKIGVNVLKSNIRPDELLFDSSWLFSGMVVEVGIHYDTAPPIRSDEPPRDLIRYAIRTHTTSDQVITFGPLPYVPTVFLIPLSDSKYWQKHGMVLLGADVVMRNFGDDYFRRGPITITNSRITIPRGQHKEGDCFREEFMYIIMAM